MLRNILGSEKFHYSDRIWNFCRPTDNLGVWQVIFLVLWFQEMQSNGLGLTGIRLKTK